MEFAPLDWVFLTWVIVSLALFGYMGKISRSNRKDYLDSNCEILELLRTSARLHQETNELLRRIADSS